MRRARLASSFAWVLLPAPSIPSSVTNTRAARLRGRARCRCGSAAWPCFAAVVRARLGLVLVVVFGAFFRDFFAVRGGGGAVGGGALGGLRLGLALVGLLASLLPLGALLAHLDHRRAVVVEAELPGPAAEALDLQSRGLVADGAALLEPARPRSRARAAGGRSDRRPDPRGRRGCSPRSRRSACRRACR